MRIAVINGDFVENVIEIDEGSDFTLPGRALVDAGDAAPGWRLIEGDLVAPSAPAVDVSAYRKQALETAMAYGNAITQSEIGQWAGIEPLSWTQQRDEAKIVRDGGTLGEDAVLPGLAVDKGISLAEYANDVWANAMRYQAVLRAAVQLRRTATNVLSDPALDTVEKVDAAVEHLKVEANALAADLGLGAAG